VVSAPTAEPVTAVTPEQFRTCFPVLEDTVHLACCSLAPRSLALDGAVQRMLEVLHEDPTPWDFWYGEVERGRQRFARLIGADAAQVAVLPGATVSAFQVASTLDWQQRPRLVATEAEYSSLSQVWAAQRPRGAQVTWVPEHDGVVAAEDVVAELDERVALVSVPHVSYRTGARLPVAEVVAAARAVGARTFVDAYQSLGVLPVDAVQMGCDYLVSGVMKYLLGLPGVAYLYVREGVGDQLDPQLTGFFGRSSPLAFDPAADMAARP